MLEVGLTKEIELTVTEDMSAASMGSGTLNVYATPSMIALMENAACSCAAEYVGDGNGSVGTALNIQHIAPTPIGMKVRAIATVTAVEGRKISFTVEAYDEKEKIGFGTHERFIIDNARFQSKCDSKSNG